MKKRKWFEVLGVQPDSTNEEVKKAYRKLVSTFHPDKGGNVNDFLELQEAWEEFRMGSKRNVKAGRKYVKFGKSVFDFVGF